MKKELFTFKNLFKFVAIILFLLSIFFVVLYNIKEYKKKNSDDLIVEESFTFLNDSNSKELTNNNELELQEKVLNDIKDKLSSNLYTKESPLIINNPFNINPLSAIIAFNTSDKEAITVTINNDLKYTTEASLTHIIPVYYLNPNESNIISLNGYDIPITINYDYNPINNSNNL